MDVWLVVGVLIWSAPPAEQAPPSFPGCVWLRICGNSAVFFTLLHRQVVDLLDWPEGQMKFETWHSPHTIFSF